MTSPLSDIRVLDLGRYIAGPYCAALLAHLGADVIRVERPGGGEDRFLIPTGGESGAILLQTGCNKRSLTLDFRDERSREVLDRLVAWADVVVANIPEAQLEKLGLGWERLQSLNPRVILCSQTAFGTEGPMAARGGFDGVGQAMSGAMYLSGTPGQPMKAAAPYVDYCTAMACSFGVMAALMQRETTGKGQRVQSSLLGTAMSLFGTYLTEQGALGIDRQPTGNQVQTSAPSDVFATADGHILVHVIGPGLFRRVATLLGRTDWLDRHDLKSDMQRGEAREEICGVMADWCAERTNAQVLQDLAGAGVPAGPVLDAQQALDHEQVAAAGLLQRLQSPTGDEPVPVPGFPFDLSDTEAPKRTYPARPGEHNREILAELGFDEAFIDSMQ